MGDLSTLHLPVCGRHLKTFLPQRWSVLQAMWLVHGHFNLAILWTMSVIMVFLRISSFLIHPFIITCIKKRIQTYLFSFILQTSGALKCFKQVSILWKTNRRNIFLKKYEALVYRKKTEMLKSLFIDASKWLNFESKYPCELRRTFKKTFY